MGSYLTGHDLKNSIVNNYITYSIMLTLYYVGLWVNKSLTIRPRVDITQHL